ncbi:MAG: SPOR domain-containing protein [Bacteroidetes bacterium]|nr:SPOR domain-containing protein [Bacteroidota bacterium]
MTGYNNRYIILKRNLLAGCFFMICLCNAPSVIAQKKPYHEDLSQLRPKGETAEIKKATSPISQPEEILPTKNINTKIDAVLDSIDQFNVLNKFIDGYTIQIYSGQKREDAMNTKKKLQEDTPELVAILLYQQPKFRVTVGKYFTKLEAQPDLLRLKKMFSTAILVPEKIQVK